MDGVLRVRVFLTQFKRGDERSLCPPFFPADLVRDALIEVDCVAKR